MLKEQPQSGSIGLGAKAAFMDDYPQRQEQQGLVMPAQQQCKINKNYLYSTESLETSVYGGMAADKNLTTGFLNRCLHPLAQMSSSNPPQISGTASQDVPNDRLSRGGVRPKDSPCFDIYTPDGNGILSQISP